MALNQEFWMQQKRREAHKPRQHFARVIGSWLGNHVRFIHTDMICVYIYTCLYALAGGREAIFFWLTKNSTHMASRWSPHAAWWLVTWMLCTCHNLMPTVLFDFFEEKHNHHINTFSGMILYELWTHHLLCCSYGSPWKKNTVIKRNNQQLKQILIH